VIETGIPPAWKAQWEATLEQLEDPLQLKMVALGLVCLVGFFAVYRPLDDELTILRRQVSEQQSRAAMIGKIDSLRRSRDSFLKAIPPDADVNFWTQYLLAAVGSSGVSLRALESTVKKIKIGEMQAVYFKIDVSGDYNSIYRLVSAIEDGEWYARVIRMRVKKKTVGVDSSLQVAVLVDQEQT
jgi:hypothetical protein